MSGGVNNVSAIAGLGSVLNFWIKTIASVYTVTAINISAGSTVIMKGSATVSQNSNSWQEHFAGCERIRVC